ncbi:MAG: aryl-sulfate sulfotransferase [Actinomycetota bacterium]
MTVSDDEATRIFAEIQHAAGTLFRALDRDGDGVLSPEEIAAAPEVLRALDTDGDGHLREADLGGPTHIYGAVRRSAIVRMLDADGDLVIGPADIDTAPERILLLDRDGDGRVTAADDLPPPAANMEDAMPMGTPAQRLEFQRLMFEREADITGPLPPRGSPEVQPGYLLVQEMNDRSDVQVSKRMLLLDDHGQIVHRWDTPYHTPEATVAYLLPDGNLLRTTSKPNFLEMEATFPVGAAGTLTIEAPDSTILWEWNHYRPGGECIHHDVEWLPNGNILTIAWCTTTAEEATALGWTRQGERDRIYLDKIIEVRPSFGTGEAEIVWEWSVADHLVQDTDPSLPNYGNPADHPERIDVNWPQLDEIQFNYGQLIHMNSVAYNAEEDVLLLSSAIFAEAWVIDHSTTTEEARGSTGGRFGRGGDLLYRWGNPQTHRAGDHTDQVLFWQHDTHWLTDDVPHTGDMLVFNNGMRRDAAGNADYGQICMGMVTGAYADVLEVTLPRSEDGGWAMGELPSIVWNYNSDGGDDVYSPFMAGARRLPNGNTVLMQAQDKRIVEVTADGEIVLDFHVGGPGRMFRIFKYPPDYPGVAALGLGT